MKSVAEQIKSSLNRAGLSCSRAAKQIGVSPACLTEVVRGKRNISIDTAFRLQALLGLDATELLMTDLETKIEEFRSTRLVRRYSSHTELEEAEFLAGLRRSPEEKFLLTITLAKQATKMGFSNGAT